MERERQEEKNKGGWEQDRASEEWRRSCLLFSLNMRWWWKCLLLGTRAGRHPHTGEGWRDSNHLGVNLTPDTDGLLERGQDGRAPGTPGTRGGRGASREDKVRRDNGPGGSRQGGFPEAQGGIIAGISKSHWCSSLLWKHGSYCTHRWRIMSLCFIKNHIGTCLVVQWLRTHLPIQGTRVWSLVWEYPTCQGATKSMTYNYWACASWSLCSTTREATAMRRPWTTNRQLPPFTATRESSRIATKTQRSQK